MNYFKVLDVQPGASDKEIKAAYYRLVKIHHPDTGGDPEMMKKINAAY